VEKLVVFLADASIENSYKLCESLAKKSNFYSGFLMLPPLKSRSFYAVYAFMRQCDDISDQPGPIEEKVKTFKTWRSFLDRALQGDPSAHPIFPALVDTIQRNRIPIRFFHELMDGTEMDLTATRYETFDQLLKYCYHVASVVGLISICLFGYKEEARAEECARACGIAFQLTNILRDVKEDFQNDRVYLPQEDLRRFNYGEGELAKETKDERFHALMKFQTDRAIQYYEKASPLVNLIHRDSRAAFWTMYLSYRTILRRIQERNFPVFIERVRLSHRQKLGIMLKALMKFVA
jgi:15-cis-phytoene synthase